MQTNPESAAVEAVAVVMRDGYICWLTSWLMSENYVKSQQGDKLYPQSALDALRGEVERLRADARRYRYLRDDAFKRSDMTPAVIVADAQFDIDSEHTEGFMFGDELDAAIDVLTKESP